MNPRQYAALTAAGLWPGNPRNMARLFAAELTMKRLRTNAEGTKILAKK